ncbi:MAG: phage minor head protein [Methanoregulaceae archaeon]|nr:phage minor head protein [Methanoregulaceae archaeon]
MTATRPTFLHVSKGQPAKTKRLPFRPLSKDRQKDPASAKPLEERYQKKIEKFLREFVKTTRDEIFEKYGSAFVHTAIPAGISPKMITEATGMAAQTALAVYGVELVKEMVEEAYEYGTDYAGTSLARAGAATGVTGLLPTDIYALEWLAERNLTALTGITEKIADDITRIVGEGIMQGLSAREVSNNIDAVADLVEGRARTISRTETMYALNQGALNRYHDVGVTKVRWITARDDQVCDECEALDGKEFDIDSVPDIPRHPNCLLPDTFCEAPELVAASMVSYSGPVIELVLSPGNTLTVTPNHMILTPDGFAAADLLNEGDYIFYCPLPERKIAIDPDNYRNPTRIDNIFNSLIESRRCSTISMPAAPEDLHGDGRGCYGNINVVRPDGFLVDDGEPRINQHLTTDSFNSGGFDSNLSRDRSLAEFLMCAAHATDGGMSALRESAPFFRTRLRHTQKHKLGASARSNSDLFQPSGYEWPGYIQSLRDCLDRFPRIVSPAKIVEVNIDTFHGKVYDLQTLSTLFIANSVIVSNCRCTTAPVVIKQVELDLSI